MSTLRFDLVGGENVVVGNDDDALLVPDLGVLAEFAFEHADGPRPARRASRGHQPSPRCCRRPAEAFRQRGTFLRLVVGDGAE